MFCWIKADTSEPPCGVVAKKMSDEAMRSLMERYGDDHRQGPDGRQIYCVTTHSIRFPHRKYGVSPKGGKGRRRTTKLNAGLYKVFRYAMTLSMSLRL